MLPKYSGRSRRKFGSDTLEPEIERLLSDHWTEVYNEVKEDQHLLKQELV